MSLFPSHLRDLARRIERGYCEENAAARADRTKRICEDCNIDPDAIKAILVCVGDTGESSDLTQHEWGLIVESLKIAAKAREEAIELDGLMA